MADPCETIKTAPPDVPSVLRIAVLSILAAMGTLATNILLRSLPQLAISLNVTSAAVTSAITVFLRCSGSASSWSDRFRIATEDVGQS